MTKEEYLSILDSLCDAINGSEFEGHVYAVGGCERDYLSDRPIKDIDLVVNLFDGGVRLAEYLQENGYTEGSIVKFENFGTVKFTLKDGPWADIEAVHTRKECYRDENGRNPEVSFGTIQEDCTRRDFTYNAIYYNISKREMEDYNGNGFDDLRKNILRSCGDPDIIFKEDGLRIMRLCRFAARFESEIDEETFRGAKRNIRQLRNISRERIREEIDGILSSDNAWIGIDLMFKLGVFDIIFPQQFNEDISFGLVRKFKHMDKKMSLPAMRTLLFMHATGPNGGVKSTMKQLKYSNDDINTSVLLKDIVYEIRGLNGNYWPAKVRQLQYKCKTEDVFREACEIFKHYEGMNTDRLISANDMVMWNDLGMYGYKLPVDGNDIMEHFGIKPGREVKMWLGFLLSVAFINGPKYLTKKTALEEIERSFEIS